MSLYELDLLDSAHGWAMALLVGLAFGFWLERAGFGSSRRLAGIFYLADFAVVQVMFTAVAVAAVGVVAFDAAGWIDAAALHRVESRLGAQVVGGLIFGVGFVVGGWCPGTALVGLASGKLDALAFLAGSMAGALAYAAVWAELEPLSAWGACGVTTLPELLGVSGGLLAAAVVVAALVLFAAIHGLGSRPVVPPTPSGHSREPRHA